MGRGRAFAGHKIVPPKGARWAPKPNGRAKCMKYQMADRKQSFGAASNSCKGVKGMTYAIPS